MFRSLISRSNNPIFRHYKSIAKWTCISIFITNEISLFYTIGDLTKGERDVKRPLFIFATGNCLIISKTLSYGIFWPITFLNQGIRFLFAIRDRDSKWLIPHFIFCPTEHHLYHNYCFFSK